jgi:N-acetylmuramoyl-L-alanine amidase
MGDGITYGVESAEIDLDYFNGDAQAFANRFNVPVPQDPVPPEPTGKKYVVNAGALYVRQGPGTSYRAVGYLQRNDIVEAFDHNADGTWLLVKRDGDGLMGWCSITYLVRINNPTPPNPDPTGNAQYRVTASALYVREGPDTSYKAVGHLIRDDLVEELESNSDKSWKHVRRLTDQLTGWCSVKFLLLISTTPTDPGDSSDDGPPDPSGNRYKVTASRLNMREGPGTSHKSLGYVDYHEIVDELETNADKSWIRIRRADGLTGWSSANYLVLVTATTPPPGDGAGTQYKITATRLNVREGPGTNYTSLGYVNQNDIVLAIGVNADETWRQIHRRDGLVGWSSAKWMTPVT